MGNVMNAFERAYGGFKMSLLLDGMDDLSRFGGPSLDADILLRHERISEGRTEITSGSTTIPSRSRAYDVLRSHAGELEEMGIGAFSSQASVNTAPPYAAVAKPMPRNKITKPLPKTGLPFKPLPQQIRWARAKAASAGPAPATPPLSQSAPVEVSGGNPRGPNTNR